MSGASIDASFSEFHESRCFVIDTNPVTRLTSPVSQDVSLTNQIRPRYLGLQLAGRSENTACCLANDFDTPLRRTHHNSFRLEFLQSETLQHVAELTRGR
jgi:hypothetical protein